MEFIDKTFLRDKICCQDIRIFSHADWANIGWDMSRFRFLSPEGPVIMVSKFDFKKFNFEGIWHQLLILEPKILKFWVISGWHKYFFFNLIYIILTVLFYCKFSRNFSVRCKCHQKARKKSSGCFGQCLDEIDEI